MSGEQEYKLGDRVILPGEVMRVYGDALAVHFAHHGEVILRAAHVHPAPPTPDPRNAAIAAVRALHYLVVETGLDDWCGECESAWPCATIRALDATPGTRP